MSQTRAMNHAGNPMTIEEYKALDAAGKIRRPITDAPIGGSTASRRSADSAASNAWRWQDSEIPARLFDERQAS